MNTLTQQSAETIITQLSVNRNLRKRLSFASLNTMPAEDWQHYDFYAITAKDGAAGVLVLQPADAIAATVYELRHVADKQTGRAKPIICDLCKTWQPGSRAGSITFRTSRRSLNSVSLLCCLDLRCSLHVRDLTDAAKMSRTQLRENLTKQQRIERLHQNLTDLAERLQFTTITDSETEQ